MRKQHPDADIVIAADDDWKTKGNPGITKATEAPRAIGAKLAVPEFCADRRNRDTDDTDFNDLADLVGADAVKRCVEAAAAPDPALESIDSDAEISRLAKLGAVE